MTQKNIKAPAKQVSAAALTNELAELKKLRERQAELETGIKTRLIAEINERIGGLKQLGLVYRLTAAAETVVKPARLTPSDLAIGPSARFDDTKFCNTCGEHGHDGRLHRGGKPKFSNEQMAALGILPPSLAQEAKGD